LFSSLRDNASAVVLPFDSAKAVSRQRWSIVRLAEAVESDPACPLQIGALLFQTSPDGF
jgi:hypothetical protein